MIQLYKRGNTQFNKNGDHVLEPTICEVTRVVNGMWELLLEHPIDEEGRHEYIENESVLKVPMPKGDQLFRIYDTDKKAEDVVTAFARPIFFDSGNEVFHYDTRPTNKNGQEALDILVNGTKYTASSNITKSSTAYYVRKNLMEAIGGDDENAFLRRWGGEVLYDNFRVIINDRIGGDYGASIEYRKNLEGLSIQENIEELATRITPVAYNGRLLSTPEKHIDSPYIDHYEIIYHKEMVFENIKLLSDIEGDPEDEEEGVIICDTQRELDAALTEAVRQQYEAGIDKVNVVLKINMIDLSKTKEYEGYTVLETVDLGDTVRCIYPKFGVDLYERVFEQTWDCIEQKNVQLILGKESGSVLDMVSSTASRISKVLDANGMLMAEKINGILNGMTTSLRIQNTMARKVNARAILFEDMDPESPMYGALSIGTQGFQVANKRTEDGRDWEWTTAATPEGILAPAVVTGILSDKFGRNYWDLDKGEFRLNAGTKIGDQSVEEYAETPLKAFIDTTYKNDMKNIQSQLDGTVESWFFEYVPTLNNYPASEWTTEVIRKNHEGDYFYNKVTGQAYRFFKNGAAWEWTEIHDAGVQQALDAASKAQAAADGKIRHFTITPYSPYDEDDLWSDGSNLYRCVRAKAEGLSYDPADWVLATTYTDDTVANQALAVASEAKNFILTLSNEYQAFSVKPDGSYSVLPEIKTSCSVFYGKIDVTERVSFGTSLIHGLTGEWDATKPIYIVTSVTQDDAFVDIFASYTDANGTTLMSTKRLNVTKVRDGAKGDKGDPGAPASPNYTWIKYADNQYGTGISDSPDGKDYMGLAYNKTSLVESTNPTDYTWHYVKGKDGKDGQSIKGDDGKTYYTWIKYADDAKGTGMSDDPTDKEYIGLAYNKLTASESTNPSDYTWSLFKGEDGVGVQNITNYYQATSLSAGVTKTTGIWVTDASKAVLTATNKYLWNYEVVTGTDGKTISSTNPTIIGTFGANGTGISSITEKYALSTTTTQPTESAFADGNPPSLTETNKYLWNYETITYTNGTVVNTAKKIIGVYGDKGAAGNDGRTWSLEVTPQYITRTDGKSETANINIASYIYSGTNASRASYAGRYKFYTSKDGSTWTLLWTSTSDEASHRTTPSTSDYKFFKVELYASGGTSQLLDKVEIPIIDIVTASEVANKLTRAEVLEKLSNGAQGIYTQDGELYIKGEYIDVAELATLQATIAGFTINKNYLQSRWYQDDNNYQILQIRPYDMNDDHIAMRISSKLSGKATVPFTLWYSGKMNVKEFTIGAINAPNLETTANGTFMAMKNCNADNVFFKVTNRTSGSNIIGANQSGSTFDSGDGYKLYAQSSSSRRYKDHVRDVLPEDVEGLLNVEIPVFKYKDGYLDPEDPAVGKEIYGFYAEDIEEKYPQGAVYNEDGSIENWDHRTIIPGMLKLIQEQDKKIKELERRVEIMEGKK